jgi:hypothetical protein
MCVHTIACCSSQGATPLSLRSLIVSALKNGILKPQQREETFATVNKRPLCTSRSSSPKLRPTRAENGSKLLKNFETKIPAPVTCHMSQLSTLSFVTRCRPLLARCARETAPLKISPRQHDCVTMSWLKSLTSKRTQPSAAAAALQSAETDDFLSDSLLPVENVSNPRHFTSPRSSCSFASMFLLRCSFVSSLAASGTQALQSCPSGRGRCCSARASDCSHERERHHWHDSRSGQQQQGNRVGVIR